MPPRLHTHDRYGHRIDEVEYVPSYHRLMQTAVSHGLHAAPWADAFCASRLGGDRGSVLGALPAGRDPGALIERAEIS